MDLKGTLCKHVTPDQVRAAYYEEVQGVAPGIRHTGVHII